MSQVGTRQDMVKRILARLGSVEAAKLAPTNEAAQDALDDALSEYQRVRPRARAVEVQGDGVARRFVLADVVPSWAEGTQRVSALELVSQAGTQVETKFAIDVSEWTIAPDAGGRSVLLLALPISTCYALRITVNEPHVVDETDPSKSTVPDADVVPLTLLGVAALAEWIARGASDMTDASLGADRIDYAGVSGRWAKRAAEARERALEILAPTPAGGTGGAASVTWQSYSTLTGHLRLAH